MEDKIKKVEDFLKKQGYPLEMQVARAFKKAGFEVYQSSIYIDKTTNKEREIDVIAYYHRRIGDVNINFKVIIECKFAKTLWVLFTGEHEGFNALQINNFYCCNYAGAQMLSLLAQTEGFSEKTWFKLDTKFAYGLTEISEEKSNNNQENRITYKAISTIRNYLEYERSADTWHRGKVFSIFIPVVVFQGNMFESYLEDNENLHIKEISEGQLMYKSNIYPGVFPVIELISNKKVQELAEKLKSDFEIILTDYKDDLSSLFDSYPIDPKHLII